MVEDNTGRIEKLENQVRLSFSPEARAELESKHWRFIPLSEGQVINLPSGEQTEFWKRWAKDWPDPDDLSKQFSEVAITSDFILKDTLNKFPEEQRRILAKRNAENKEKGYVEVEGGALDYAKIASAVYEGSGEEGENLFSEDKITGTKTRIDRSRVYLGGPKGPLQHGFDYNYLSEKCGLAPIAVPLPPQNPTPARV